MFDDFDDDDFDDFDPDDFENPFDKVEQMPIYRKAMEISDTVQEICDLIPDDESMLAHIKMFLLEDSMMIPAKISGAEAGDIYDLRMENAAIIRKCARDLMVRYHSLDTFGFEHVEYYKMVRQQIEEFRLLFIDWVAGFDPWNYIVDDWGLFNPPGVGPHDKQF
ncbi:hypothetical protein [Petrimonas sp.]|uniref:hypothetical protein n=1 Tax=Petrimonas sp. TaxID=2023866 RepID=UPI003F50E011